MILVLLLTLLTTSCQRHSQWQYHHINEKTANATRVLYRSTDPVQGIDVEMIEADGQLATYLQVHSQPLLPSHEDPQKTEVKIYTTHGEKTFLAHYHLGEQRVRLSEVLQAELISVLKEGNPVTLELVGYRETIDPSHFQKVFQRSNQKAPSAFNRIRLY
ncbi:MAG: hypothetical protein KR126chlam3_00360 [Chlamydiae bacterium]|nr:hypothetical protein [Chlamydiota bacterium]